MTILPTIPYTTTNRIKAILYSKYFLDILLKALGKTNPDDEPLLYLTIVELCEKKIITLDDFLWFMRVEPKYNDIWKICALKFAKEVSHLMLDPSSLKTLDVSEDYLNGVATKEELKIATKEAFYKHRAFSSAAEAVYQAACAAQATVDVYGFTTMAATNAINAVYYTTYYNTKNTEDDEAEYATNAANAACAAARTRQLQMFKKMVS